MVVCAVCGSLEMCMYSTESVVASLENRVFKVGDPVIPVSPILKQWVEEGREVTKLQLENLVYRLTQSRRFTHALQVISHFPFSWTNLTIKCVFRVSPCHFHHS